MNFKVYFWPIYGIWISNYGEEINIYDVWWICICATEVLLSTMALVMGVGNPRVAGGLPWPLPQFTLTHSKGKGKLGQGWVSGVSWDEGKGKAYKTSPQTCKQMGNSWDMARIISSKFYEIVGQEIIDIYSMIEHICIYHFLTNLGVIGLILMSKSNFFLARAPYPGVPLLPTPRVGVLWGLRNPYPYSPTPEGFQTPAQH